MHVSILTYIHTYSHKFACINIYFLPIYVSIHTYIPTDTHIYTNHVSLCTHIVT